MNQHSAKLTRNASAAVILPIAALLGGLFVGSLRARGRGLDEFAQIGSVIKWGVMGFFAGVALVVLMAFVGRQRDQVSMRKLMALVAVVGVLTWFFARILSEVVGYEGF